jgi:hypothetical protein
MLLDRRRPLHDLVAARALEERDRQPLTGAREMGE